MIFTKNELEFLDLYSLTTENKKDNRRDIYGKILIRTNKEKQKVTFSQFSSDANLYTELEKEVIEDFELVVPTLQACSLIKLLPDTAQIEFTNEGIKYNNNKYSFEKEEVTFPEISEFVELYKNSTEAINVKDLSKFNRLKSFVGSYENNTDAVMSNKGKFLTKNVDMMSSISTENDVDLLYFFSKIFISVASSNKLKTVELKKFSIDEDTNYSACKINDTYIFIVDKVYLIPNIFEEKFVRKYSHTNKIEVDKKELLDSLSRLKLFTNANLDNRIFVESISKDQIKIKTDLENSVVEIISGLCDEVLIGSTTILSSFPLMQVCSEFEGDKVSIYIDSEGKSSVVRVEDENGKDFYLLRVFAGD